MQNQNDYQNSEDENQENNSSSGRLNKGQKIGASALAVFAILLIFLWSAQLKKNISGPLDRKNSGSSEIVAEKNSEDSEESLRNKDTDSDGLSDWDELYFYKTSPYLEDSDSDGFTDKQEIDNSKDPNCPVGRDCYRQGIVDGDESAAGAEESNANSGSLDSLLGQFGVEDDLPPAGGQQIGALFPSDISADDLRKMLAEYGMDKKILDQLSDEQLLESYKEILGQ
ncbi:hypothetical protein KKC83_05150 [Patescibacteria group bacterium]|nr:hypothetical protein [Candidatus Falkowbacteria bacterium]MBU3906300.1 hypothetical protein [Patescibacteria group bacterium]MBU4015327.1 hypothetical protein [Patescibacteria group bacterium]MBU4026905.1 hypothetical protein [Patescibacteria group bacterium]MBU4072928.1 hypothetical protein [Patescibacteria group bacterium]